MQQAVVETWVGVFSDRDDGEDNERVLMGILLSARYGMVRGSKAIRLL